LEVIPINIINFFSITFYFYLSDFENNELTTLFEGATLREVNVNYSWGAKETKYYSFHPFKDAYLVEKDVDIIVNLNWIQDKKGSFYKKSLDVDKDGRGVSTLRITTSNFKTPQETVSHEDTEKYSQQLGTDFYKDLSSYCQDYGIKDTHLREIKERLRLEM